MSWVSSTLRVAAVTLSLVVSAGVVTTPAEAVDEPAGVTTKARFYPLASSSLPSGLSRKDRRRLPRIRTWTTTIIGSKMDQPGGLMPVQVVSALHIRNAFRKKYGPKGWQSAIRIAWRESRLLPNVVGDNSNGSHDWGLFQLNDGGTLQYAGGKPDSTALVPEWNARAAAGLVGNVGWGPWGGML